MRVLERARRDCEAGVQRQVGVDRVGDARGKQGSDAGRDELQPDECREASRGTAKQRAEAEAERAERGQEQRGADDRTQRVRIGQAVIDAVRGDDRLRSEER
jgi:hypothetical protein